MKKLSYCLKLIVKFNILNISFKNMKIFYYNKNYNELLFDIILSLLEIEQVNMIRK